jgi:hypothetical protein
MEKRDKLIEDYGTIVKLDIIKHFLRDYIGSGTARDVYYFNDDYVCKVENKSHSFQNVNEERIWSIVKDTKWSKWFAPVLNISPCGILLIQRKVKKIETLDELPNVIPEFFSDLKLSNYGYIGKQFVAIDYGLSNIEHFGLKNSKLVKIDKSKWRLD